MADKSHIEWTDATWSPLVGCTKVSPGCDHCYAEGVVTRWHAAGKAAFPAPFGTVTIRDDRFLTLPLSKKWAAPRRIFVNSLSDLFHTDVPEAFIARVFAVMACAPQHTFQLLTKRHARMRSLLSRYPSFAIDVLEAAREIDPARDELDWPLPNVWLGVSVEDQHWADIRIPALLDTPAAVRWISAEPLLGPLDFSHDLVRALLGTGHLDWVVVGGESGRGARPMQPQWARDLLEQCQAADVPFLFKQWGAHDQTGRRVGKARAGRELDGITYDGYPAMVVPA